MHYFNYLINYSNFEDGGQSRRRNITFSKNCSSHWINRSWGRIDCGISSHSQDIRTKHRSSITLSECSGFHRKFRSDRYSYGPSRNLILQTWFYSLTLLLFFFFIISKNYVSWFYEYYLEIDVLLFPLAIPFWMLSRSSSTWILWKTSFFFLHFYIFEYFWLYRLVFRDYFFLLNEYEVDSWLPCWSNCLHIS